MYLSLNNIYKVFPPRGGASEVTAVKGVSLDVERGELVTLLGPSGCGKTTTLRIIAGFEFPTSGSIDLDGKAINMLPPNKRDMSMVFQSYAIFPHLNVYENIAYGLNVQHLSQEVIDKRLQKVLSLVQLNGMEKRAPNQLSGGQQQRVALARALVMEPKVLLMDEPLSNLDAKLREQMRTEIRRIQRELNITSVYVTHDQLEAMTLSDRVVIMNQGVIEQVGTPQDVYRHPRTRFIANFIGRANFVEGKIVSVHKDGMDIEMLGQSFTLERQSGSFAAGQRVTLIIRPEMIRVNAGEGAVNGMVRRASYLGDSIDYDVMVGDQMLTAVEADPLRITLIPEGSAVNCTFAVECIHILVE